VSLSAFLIFEAASQTFALPAHAVRRVLRMAAATPVPGAPPGLRGVLDVHGTLVPVVDVRVRLGLPPRTLDPDGHLVLALAGTRLVALEVDRVVEIRDLPDGAVEGPGGWSFGSALVAGAVKLAEGVVLVQALDRFADLLSAPDGAAPAP
jgi:purine-binding chemotaxis protein CheW